MPLMDPNAPGGFMGGFNNFIDKPGMAPLLMQAGLGLLAAGQPMPLGQNRYAVAGQGLQAGITSANQVRQTEILDEYRKAQMAQLQTAADEKQKKTLADDRYSNSLIMGMNGPRKPDAGGLTGQGAPGGFLAGYNGTGMTPQQMQLAVQAGHGDQVTSALMKPPEKANQPPPGYRPNAAGGMEFIPGGPADPEQAARLRPPATPRQTLAEIQAEAEARAKGTAAGRPAQESGPYAGTSPENQDLNYLLTGDPTTPTYAAAFGRYGSPKVSVDPQSGQTTSTRYDMSMFRKPTYQVPGAAPSTVSPSATPATTTSVPGAEITTIPGAPPSRPIPAPINTAISENLQAVRKIDQAMEGLGANADATGWKGYLPDKMLNNYYPEGTTTRATIADIGSLKIHDRSGASTTVSETPRLVPFIPTITDSPEVVKKKLSNLRIEYSNMLNDFDQVYSSDQGYKPHPVLSEYMKSDKAKGGSAKMPPPPPGATLVP